MQFLIGIHINYYVVKLRFNITHYSYLKRFVNYEIYVVAALRVINLIALLQVAMAIQSFCLLVSYNAFTVCYIMLTHKRYLRGAVLLLMLLVDDDFVTGANIVAVKPFVWILHLFQTLKVTQVLIDVE